jgi:colanic acid/amylovoran biosynthesis glycosyltransferase
MKIIIFDGSFETTAFINRLIQGLSEKHQVYVLGFNEKLKTPITGVNYIKLGSNSNKLSFIKTSLSKAFSQFSIKLWCSTLLLIIKFNRKQLQNQNFKIAIDSIKPDIIHAQWVSNIPILEPILSQNKYPVVLSQRGYHINVRPFIDKENFNYLKQWFPKMAGFHSVSKAISKKGDLIYSHPTKIDHVVYSGLDLSLMPFNSNYKKDSRLKLISVGRPHWKKGYVYALKACALLKKQGLDFKYTIVGAGQHEELMYLCAFYNLGDRVAFKDALPQQTVFKAIVEADAMLLPSLEEGVANVAIEAMALGTLVISTDCGGMPELIEHEKEGWIVPLRNPEALADAVIDYNNASDLKLDDMRQQARIKIENKFTDKHMLQGMERLYKACQNENN